MKRRFLGSATGLLLVVLTAGQAEAQATSKGFALDRFDPSERGSDWFALESLDLRGHKRLALGFVEDWAYKPLVLYNTDGSERSAIVRHQLFSHVGGSLVLWQRLRVGLNIPILTYQAGDGGVLNGTRYAASTGANVGDIRVGADVGFLGRHGGPLSLAGGVQLYVPSGSRDSYAGDGTVRVVPRVMAAGDVGAFTYAGRIGINIRPQTDSVAGSPMGSEIAFGAAAGFRTSDKKLIVGPELYGSTVVTDSNGFFKKRTTPFELLVGAHYHLNSDWRVGGGVGPGLTRGFGAAEVRGVLSVEWFPAPAEATPPVIPDRDGDGVPDAEDACPDKPGPRNSDPEMNGCPPPPDRDGDGIPDAKDACPDKPGPANQDPMWNGCPPPPDRDGDGVHDAEDACVDTPGVKTDDPKTNGCPPPPPDTDKDTIPDPQDACPEQPGSPDPDPKKNGCPAARIEQGQIVIVQQVKFETGKSTILPVSNTILTAVATILNEHPEIKLVGVQGHTDNKGVKQTNKVLSSNRARAVVGWLVKHGISAKRLSSEGFGQERPIDTNETDEGRQNNRRVEFHILDPKPQQPSKP